MTADGSVVRKTWAFVGSSKFVVMDGDDRNCVPTKVWNEADIIFARREDDAFGVIKNRSGGPVGFASWTKELLNRALTMTPGKMSEPDRDEAFARLYTEIESANKVTRAVLDSHSTGTKHDAGKRPWGLVPWRAMGVVVDVLAFGAKEYGDNNWQLVKGARRRYFEALIRHVTVWYEGTEVVDSKSGLHHLAHAACCTLFLLSFEIGAVAYPTTEVVTPKKVGTENDSEHGDETHGTGRGWDRDIA